MAQDKKKSIAVVEARNPFFHAQFARLQRCPAPAELKQLFLDIPQLEKREFTAPDWYMTDKPGFILIKNQNRGFSRHQYGPNALVLLDSHITENNLCWVEMLMIRTVDGWLNDSPRFAFNQDDFASVIKYLVKEIGLEPDDIDLEFRPFSGYVKIWKKKYADVPDRLMALPLAQSLIPGPRFIGLDTGVRTAQRTITLA